MLEVKGQVKGGAELAKMLRALPGIAQERVVLSSLRAGGRLVRDDFDAVTPRGPRGKDRSPASIEYGAAHEKLRARRLRRRLAVRVGFGSAFYLRFRERGTAHQPAVPVFRPLWDANIGSYLDRIVKGLAQGIRREARKLDQQYNKARKALGIR